MKKITKAILFIIVILIGVTTITLISRYNAHRYEEERELMAERMAMLDKAHYGNIMGFGFRIVVDGEEVMSNETGPGAFVFVSPRINPRVHQFDPFYTDLVFVLNEDEAQEFPDNIIAAWPRLGEREPTERILNEIYHGVSLTEGDLIWPGAIEPFRAVVTLEEFGLSYPLTAYDFTNNWKQVNALWSALQWTGGVRSDE